MLSACTSTSGLGLRLQGGGPKKKDKGGKGDKGKKGKGKEKGDGKAPLGDGEEVSDATHFAPQHKLSGPLCDSR